MNNYNNILPYFIQKPNVEYYLSPNYLVVDFETTNYDKGHPRWKQNNLVMASWRFQGRTKHKYGNIFEMEELCSDLEKCDFIVAHNAKFELGWLLRIGYPINKLLVWCTQIAEKTIISNRVGYRLDLDSCLERRGMPQKATLVKTLIHQGVCPSNIPRRLLTQYCDQDVEVTEILFQDQLRELLETGLVRTHYTKCLLTPVLAELETVGLCLDKERVDVVHTKILRKLERLRTEYNDFTGGINRGSPKQVAEFIYDKLGFDELTDKKGNPLRTAGGNRQTGEAIINQLKANNKLQRRFIELHREFTEVNTQYIKYLSKFKEASDKGDLLFGNFNQTVTDTDRLSSTGAIPYKVQLQNIQRDFKPLICARHSGWNIHERDQAQLEFRIATQLGRDKQGISDIRERVDVHTRTAQMLTDAGQPTDRQTAKNHTFKPLFGGTSGTKPERLYYEWFKQQYPNIVETQEGWINDALRRHQSVVADTGKIFYWPKAAITQSGYIISNEPIRNYPIQYFAGELVQVSVVITWHLLKILGLQAFLINTVHDSIIAEVPPEELEAYNELTEYATVQGVYDYYKKHYDVDFVVPLETEAMVHKNWANKTKWEEEWLTKE